MMKRLFALLTALCLLALPAAALAEAEAGWTRIEFPEGFALSLPEDWLCYEVSEADAAAGLAYVFSDAEGAHQLYISRAETGAASLEELAEALTFDRVTIPTGNTVYVTFVDGTSFGAAMLLDGAAWEFLFTGAEDGDFLSLAGEIMEGYAELEPSEEVGA